MWSPDPRSQRRIGDTEIVTCYSTQPEGAHRVTFDDGRILMVYPHQVSTLKRALIIRRALEQPDRLAAVVGALELEGVDSWRV